MCTVSQVPPAKCKSTASFGAESKKKKKRKKPRTLRGKEAIWQIFSGFVRRLPLSLSPDGAKVCLCGENVAQFIWSTARLSGLRVSLQNKPHTAQDHLAADASEVKHTIRIVPRETLFARIARDRQNVHTIKSTQTLKKKRKSVLSKVQASILFNI